MSARDPHPPANASRAARILVVDDNPVNCELLEAMLLPEGYDVEQAYSGKEALECAARQRPDMVLLDVNMPQMDGFEVARHLRADDVTRTIPVVMVTALGDLDHRVRGMESGADDYLTKPVSQVELLARVQSSLRLSWLRQQVDERRKLELILGDVSDGVVIVDAEARIVDASPSARRHLHIDAAESHLDEIWHELHGVPTDLHAAVAEGQRLDFTLQRDTPPLFLRVNMRPVHDPEGVATGAVLLVRDVTDDTIEHRVQQDVLSLVSHKFRTPLTVVHSWTDVLLEDGCGPLASQQREALQAVAASTQQLRDMLNGILAYVEWTQRLQHLRPERVTLMEIARDLRHRALTQLGGDERLDIEHTGGYIVADSALLLDALAELIENARKFGTDTTTVRVSMRVESPRDDVERGARDDIGASEDTGTASGTGTAVIDVVDDGPGVPPEHLERIFQRFYQVETDFTGQVRGLGLGLSRVQRAVRAMGGELDVHSTLGQGSRFSIIFKQTTT